MAELRFDEQTVVITDTASELGKVYGAFFVSRGANVVLNIIPRLESEPYNITSSLGEKISLTDGRVAVTYEKVVDGQKIIEKAVSKFGRVDILINNAGFDETERDSWDSMVTQNIKGAYNCARAAWPHFRKQRHGRIVNTASAVRFSSKSSQINHSVAKFAQLGFTESLAKEGLKYNILATVVATAASSYLTGALVSHDSPMNLDLISSLVAVLVHPTNNTETGSLFEVEHDNVFQLRWERAAGSLLKPDKTLTPSAVLTRWKELSDFSEPSYPQGPADIADLMAKAKGQKPNGPGERLHFDGKVALITGAGAGLGREYALALSGLGAAVVVNDVKDPSTVVDEIRKKGGAAVGSVDSVEHGAKIVKTAIDAYGRVDIVINNAGFVRDKAFVNMDDDCWNSVIDVHLRGTYNVTKAAWPYLMKQESGRVINTTSTSGIYGSFGQTNYAAAKLGILGLSDALAREGAQHNIQVNTIAPIASTGGLAAALGEVPSGDDRDFKPEYIAPLVVLLSSDKVPKPATGTLIEVSGGWHARTRLQRSTGWDFSRTKITPEAMLEVWSGLVKFVNTREYSIQAHGEGKNKNQAVLENIERRKATTGEGLKYSFDDKDVILYNLGVGAKRSDLSLLYEGSPEFKPLPTFGIVPFLNPSVITDNASIVPNFDVMKVLHGEHYLEIRKFPLPTSGTLMTTSKLLEVVDKGDAALTITSYTTRNANTLEDLFYNELSFFIRGSGGFGGVRKASTKNRPTAASLTHTVPARKPDVVREDKTWEEQAAIYRLSGDRMGMHIDPGFSSKAGFPTPILHGLCFFGFAGRHVYQTFGSFRNIKVRFSGIVIPGQTLRTEMWKEANRWVKFQVRVVETGKLCIAGGGAELLGMPQNKL